jgi:hypothetical protein
LASVDFEVTVCIGQYSLDISAEGVDGPYLDQALHFIVDHVTAMQKLPTVKKAMGTPLKVDDLD